MRLLPLLATIAKADYTPWDWHYARGKLAYSEERWVDTITELESAINQRRFWHNSQADCRLSCAYVPEETHARDFGVGFQQYSILRGSCITRCIRGRLGPHWQDQRFDEEIEIEFRNRVPYQYLNVAYYNTGRLNDAVAAAFTYFQANPSDDEHMSTLDFYQEMPNVDQAMFVDVEARLHVKAFEEATEAYVAERYEEAIKLFHNALDEWYEEFADCRALCERPVDFGDKYKDELPGYHKFQVAHMSQVIDCRLRCIKRMESRNDEYNRRAQADLLPIHYHYLMFAYNQVGNTDAAIKMAKTFLMFHPDNEDMLNNLKHLTKEKETTIEPDEKAKSMYNQAMKEVAMLEYMERHLNLEFDFAVKQPFPDEKTFEKEDADRLQEADDEWERFDLMEMTPWDPDYDDKLQHPVQLYDHN